MLVEVGVGVNSTNVPVGVGLLVVVKVGVLENWALANTDNMTHSPNLLL